MSELKGLDKINNILNDFLTPFECKAEVGPDFAYWYATNTITYSFVTSERMEKLFKAFAKSIGLKVDVDIFLLSLMHEVGHVETWDELSKEECVYSQDVKEILTDSDEDCEIYFNLPDEYEATAFAVDYINEHENELKNWWNNKLQPAIMDFYGLNKIA